jgi:hypothetical protein
MTEGGLVNQAGIQADSSCSSAAALPLCHILTERSCHLSSCPEPECSKNYTCAWTSSNFLAARPYIIHASVQRMDGNKRWIAGDTLPYMALAFPPPLKWGGAVSCMHCAMAMAFLDPYQLLLTASEKNAGYHCLPRCWHCKDILVVVQCIIFGTTKSTEKYFDISSFIWQINGLIVVLPNNGKVTNISHAYTAANFSISATD